MYEFLQKIKDDTGQATFLLPSLPTAVNGTIVKLARSRVVIETKFSGEGELKGKTVMFVTHPNTVVVVT